MPNEYTDGPYCIVRFFQDESRTSEIVTTGLTLKQAQAHCNAAGTRGDGWFDGYDLESSHPNKVAVFEKEAAS